MFDGLSLYTVCAFINIALGVWAIICKKPRFIKALWLVVTTCAVIQLVAFFSIAGLYALSGIAPTCGLGILTLCLYQIAFLRTDLEVKTKRPQITMSFVVLLSLVSLIPEVVRHTSFMMTYIYAVLFFLSRPLSLGLTLFALGGLFEKPNHKGNERLLGSSKDAAFLATILFLGGEIVGCYWGFMGWATTWRWTGNFYFSAMIFVLYMVSLHIPRSLFPTQKKYNRAFAMPLIIIALATVLPKVIRI